MRSTVDRAHTIARQEDCSPTTEIISRYQNNTKLRLYDALPELIDNSLDAGADLITIEFSRRRDELVVTDDGHGCRDLKVMVRPGAHFREIVKKPTIGRYGIGLKETSAWLALEMEIESRYRGFLRRAFVDWEWMQKNESWSYTSYDAVRDPGPSYTTIHFRRVFQKSDRISGRAVCLRKLSELFTPALNARKRIVFDGEDLTPVDPPELTDRLEHEGVFEGKRFRLTAGLLAASKDTAAHSGYALVYRYRVIQTKLSDGCGSYSTARFYGYVELFEEPEGPRWAFDPLKCGIGEAEALLESLFPLVEDLLKKGQQHVTERELQVSAGQAEQELNATIQRRIKEKRAPRRPRPELVPPASDPKSPAPRNGSPRQNAEKVDEEQPGSVVRHFKGSRIKILFDWPDVEAAGHVDTNRHVSIIHLSPEFPFWKKHAKNPVAVLTVAAALFIAHQGSLKDGDPVLPIGDPRQMYAYFLRGFTELLGLNNPENSAGGEEP